MKKLVCLILILWMPIFMASAHAISTQMSLINVLQNDIKQSNALPCHGDAHHQPINKQATKNCVVCGFCVIANVIAPLTDLDKFCIFNANHQTPLYFSTALHSQSYPPAIKPPILN